MIALLIATIAFTLAALAIWVLRARPRNPINFWFASYTFSLAGWAAGLAVLHSGLVTEFAARFVFAASSFLPGCFLAFTRVFPTSSRWPSPSVVRSVVVIGGIFSLLSISTSLLVHDAVITDGRLTRQSGLLYPLFSTYFLAIWSTALAVFVVKWRVARGHARGQLQYLGIGLTISGIGGISANLLMPLIFRDASYTWLGPFFSPPLVVLVGHAIIRHRLMDLRLVLHRGIAYAAVIGSIAALVAVGARLLPLPSTQHLPWVVGFAVLLMLSTPIQRPIGRLIDRYLYRGRLDYGAMLRAATRRLSRLMQPSEVADELQAIVNQTLIPEFCVMVLRSGSGNRFEMLSTDPANIYELFNHTAYVKDFIRSQQTPFPFIVNTTAADEPKTNAAQSELRDIGVEVLLTLGRRGNIFGAVLLGPRRSGEPYFDSDLALLESLCDLTSIALENALLYRERLQMERHQRRVEHLAMMARFYTGIAHEIRSPLASISNFIAMLPDRFDDPEYRDTAVRLLPVEVARITRLADRLRLMAPSESGRLTTIELPCLLTDIVAIHSLAAETRGIKIVLHCSEALPVILGDQGQLVQLFVNLINNAIEAMPSGGAVLIQARRAAQAAFVVVTISDEGTGIEDPIASKVFEPFFTTKSSGTGLGLSICREIAEFHHATLSLKPRTDSKGTVATVEFPLPASDGDPERKRERQ